jgi:hypothetical protein
MKIVRHTETELVLEDSSLWLAAVMCAAAVFLAYGAFSTGKKLTLISAVLFVLFAFFSLHKTTIVFDSLRRIVNWQRLHFFKRSSGSIAYDDIKEIVMETSTRNTEGRVTYRLAIATGQGSWPMSESYGGNSERYASLGKEIREFLKLTPLPNAVVAQPSATDAGQLDASIRALLAQGQKIDAIKLLRSAKFIGLKEAKQRVDEIEKQSGLG